MDYRTLFKNWDDLLDCRAGETVYAEGDPAVAMYVVLDGEVELRRHGEATSVEQAGGIIGESALLEPGVQSGSAVARSDARLARLDRDQLKSLMDGNAEFALQVMAALAKRLRAVDAYIGSRIAAEKGAAKGN